jgi:hypothetical protein
MARIILVIPIPPPERLKKSNCKKSSSSFSTRSLVKLLNNTRRQNTQPTLCMNFMKPLFLKKGTHDLNSFIKITGVNHTNAGGGFVGQKTTHYS